MILVIGLSHDSTILHTIRRLRNSSSPFVFFDVQHFIKEGEYLWDNRLKKGYIGYGEIKIEFPNTVITGVYARLIDLSHHFEGVFKQEITSKMLALTEILQQLDIFTINRPFVDISNASKVYHLSLLAKCGFLIPASLLTNDEFEVHAFVKNYKEVIYKGASSAKTIVSLYNCKLESELGLIKNSPVLFQEKISGLDIRTHLIGDKCYSEKIESSAIDYRFNTEANKFYETLLPDELINKCKAYQEMSGLNFIGFDFKLTKDNHYIVMEANPMPGYEGYDIRLNHKISNHLIALLSQKGTIF
ncbi:RimK family alpha-L-glutamate ligase [Paenibacillus glucanolyticus]|uniref:RimK family alpha-L-glutamate ligase n=1 Tax=Paenibacillus glucanolyticus TaxID=59843 RepID=UPI0034CDFB98